MRAEVLATPRHYGRMDRGVGLSDEQSMERAIDIALHQGNHSEPHMGLAVGQPTKVSKIQGAVAHPLHGCVIAGWDHQFDRLA